MAVALSTKAQTLQALQGRIVSARILPLLVIEVGAWRTDRERTTKQILAKFGTSARLIVRSSCSLEDGQDGSLAGHFTSVADVSGPEEIAEAIDEVVRSYGTGKLEAEQVLIQPLLADIFASGVALTRDPATGGHYVIINYDVGGTSDGVTSGRSKDTLLQIAAKDIPDGRLVESADSLTDAVRALCHELETVLHSDSLDIEFAVDRSGRLYLFQVRPLVLRTAPAADRAGQMDLLDNVHRLIERGMQPHPYLHGDRTMYGVMPDWNPAEIIGRRPRPLALSLYKDLVTDSIWAYQRNNYGYKNLRSFPLLVHFSGLPYIDVRVSFNSFIPSEIDGALADRLANYYLDRLESAPFLHDKVEFEIIFSCYALDLPKRLQGLTQKGFQPIELERLASSLRTLTNRIIGHDGLWRHDRSRLQELEKRRTKLLASTLSPVQQIYWLLEDCKRYGVLPFAGLARAAFVAVQMLRSLVAEGLLSSEDYDAFMGSVQTVSSEITDDLARGDIDAFLKKHGHLRPGAYDIRSARYDEAPELYFAKGGQASTAPTRPTFSLKPDASTEISRSLETHGLNCGAAELFEFIRGAIEWRERSKHMFSRNLSDALSKFADLGADLGFSRDDLSFAHIHVITELNGSDADPKSLIGASIEAGKRRYGQTLQLNLPALITKPQDVWNHRPDRVEPNFITKGDVIAPCRAYHASAELEGTIVMIESADPGFDWIFSKNIRGLVTAYGGTNSHMAIRAGELCLPSVIGAGEDLFRKWSKAAILHLDCANHKVEILR